MISFNLSIDFELGWGDLTRLASDDDFYHRVQGGREQSSEVIEILAAHGIPSTWGVVGACCADNVEELRSAAPRAFEIVFPDLERLADRRRRCSEVLFGREIVKAISQSPLIDLGSHGFLHLVAAGLDTTILREDLDASVSALHGLAHAEISSFIPPQNYHWPDEAFARSEIRFVRHTPRVFGYAYSDPRVPAKFARLWNDLVRPVADVDREGRTARLFFLRLDRGHALWRTQLRMLRKLIASGTGSVFCFTHPHNLDTPLFLRRFSELCELVAENRAQGRLAFRRFVREFNGSQAVPD